MTSAVFPGSYVINQLVIYPLPNSEQTRSAYDFRNIVVGLTITESITQDSIRGSINILDTVGLLEFYPIRGEEKIFIDVTDALGFNQTYYGYVYRVDNLEVSGSNDKTKYTLHFVSYQRGYSDKMKLTAAYNKKISETVEQIFNTTYRETSSSRTDTNKQITVEETDGIIKTIIPNMTPFQSILFLESRAYSEASKTCSFRFFERTDGFYFVTDEFLLKKAIDNDSVFTFVSADHIPNIGTSLITQMLNMSDIKNTDRFDTFDDMHGGTYKNKVLVADIVTRTINLKDQPFDYMAQRASYFKNVPDQSTVDRHSQSFIDANFTNDTARTFLLVKDYVEDTAGQLRGEQYIPQIVTNKLAYLKHLNSITVTSKSPGRLDITCGDFIDLEVLNFYAAGTPKDLNKQLSGLYLVETVTRSFGVDDIYTNTYRLLKRNWNVEPQLNTLDS